MEYPLKDKYKGYIINLDTGDTGNTIKFNTTINEEKIVDKNIESLKSRIDTIIANQFEEYDIILDMKSTIMLFTVIGETEDGNKLILMNSTTPRYVI
jgi:chromosome condensin MukBEF ATPase and DNA-binding subunit MukB